MLAGRVLVTQALTKDLDVLDAEYELSPSQFLARSRPGPVNSSAA
jgi:hypothetical protein